MQLRKSILIAAILATSVSATPVHRRPAASASARIVPLFTGTVDHTNADRFLTIVYKHVDKVIGMKVSIEASRDGDLEKYGYLALYDDNQLSVSKSDKDGGTEVVLNGPVDHGMGMYQIDGFFIVKAGGLHQGTASFGLQPVDESTVRLNPAVKITQQAF